MKHNKQVISSYILSLVKIAMLVFCGLIFWKCSFAAGQTYLAGAAEVSLKAKYVALNKQLLNNQFNQEIFLNSEESPSSLKGEIYAVVEYPFSTFNSALSNPSHWCDAMTLNLNVKYCSMEKQQVGSVMLINIGTKYPQQLSDTYRLEFKYHEIVSTQNYFSAELDAKDGPLGTYNYSILIEATPIKNGHTFLHFTYSYAFGLTGRLAMQTYLATIGRSKIGFTITGQQSDGHPNYIKGVRGVVERNTMRYYLAIDAYLAAFTLPVETRLERSLTNWYSGSEQYALQLHEVELNEYLDMKHQEYRRQQTLD